MFNDNSTIVKDLTRRSMRKKVFLVGREFLDFVDSYGDEKLNDDAREHARKQIIHYLSDKQEFTAMKELNWQPIHGYDAVLEYLDRPEFENLPGQDRQNFPEALPVAGESFISPLQFES